MLFWLGLWGILGVVILLVVLRVEKLPLTKPPEDAYRPKNYLYDQTERQFLGHLVWAVGKHAIIFGKVRLADLLNMNHQLPSKTKKTAYEKIARLHVDFVLCHKKTTKIICVIELFDPGAKPRAALMRAQLLDRICRQAGIPLLRFPRANKYLSKEIESSIEQALAIQGVYLGSHQKQAVNS